MDSYFPLRLRERLIESSPVSTIHFKTPPHPSIESFTADDEISTI